jgi:hypothetical protein
VYVAKFEAQELQLREMEVLRAGLERKEQQLGESVSSLSAATSDILTLNNLIELRSKQLADLEAQMQSQNQKHLSTIADLAQELASSIRYHNNRHNYTD